MRHLDDLHRLRLDGLPGSTRTPSAERRPPTADRLRAVLGDNGRSPTFIETVPRVGYRFIVPVIPVEAAATRSRSGSFLAKAAVYAVVALAAAALALGIVHRHYGQIIQRATAGQR